MKTGSLIAIYLVTWWATFFTVLPFGIRNNSEAGVSPLEGHDPGAPVSAGLWLKAAINSVIAALLTALIWWAVTHGWLN